MSALKHPAPFSPVILAEFDVILREYVGESTGHGPLPLSVLDPFAGTGLIHRLPWPTTGVELLPKWAAMHPLTREGDATHLPRRWSGKFAAVVTSPCYGNRMADAHTPRDRCSECKGSGIDPAARVSECSRPARRSKKAEAAVDALKEAALRRFAPCKKCSGSGLSPRRSYKHDYGEGFDDVPREINAGAMQWGQAYRDLHRAAWVEAWRVLKPGGYLIVNLKDHVRDGKRVRVSAWHLRACQSIGFEHVETVRIPLDGMRYGANHEARVTHEVIYVLRKAER